MNIVRDNYRVEGPVCPRRPVAASMDISEEECAAWMERIRGYKCEMEEYDRQCKEYYIRQEEMNKRYKEDVIRELGLEGNGKAEGIWGLAEDIARDAANDDVSYSALFEHYIEKLARLVG